MMKEDILVLVEVALDSQFDKGWDAGVQAAFEIIEQEVGGLGHTPGHGQDHEVREDA